MRVLLLQHKWNIVSEGIAERQPGRIPASPHHTRGVLAAHLASDPAPRAQRTTNGLPVFPRTCAIERVQIEELERKAYLRQHVALDASLCANEEWLDARIGLDERARYREAGIQVATGATASEDNPHRAGSARRARGSVAATPNTFSRVLPMLIRIPVMTRERIRLERP